jgi:hypothetical protein
MPNQGHKAQEMFEGLTEFLTVQGLSINDCRGQSYDNASAMSGKYNGLQAKVASKNELAAWIPCAGHSLNLVGQAAASCCPAAVGFFDFLEDIYVFFTASTRRYEILTNKLKLGGSQTLTPKRLSTTRWSCRADATRALVEGYSHIQDALMEIAESVDELPDVRCKASGLNERMCMLETGVYTVFWHDILNRCDATTRALQNPQCDLNTAVASLKSLKHFVESKRDGFTEYERQGAAMSGASNYAETRKRSYNKRLDPLDYGHAPEAELTPSQKFRVGSFLPVIDQFVSALALRLTAYESICLRFGFLGMLHTLTVEDIEKASSKLVEIYKDDLDHCLGIELVQFAAFSKLFQDEKSDEISQENFLYSLLLEKQVESSFPNVEIALRMYLVLMVANSSGERSFSKLKYIKNRLRTTMAHERLSHLTLLSIEHDILRDLDFEGIISDFASRKARKVPI